MSQTEHKNISKIISISVSRFSLDSVTALYARQFCQQSGSRLKSTV